MTADLSSGIAEEPPRATIKFNRPLLDELKGLTRLGNASRYEDEIFGIVDHIPLLEDLRRAEVSALCACMECFSVKRGDTVMKEGDSGRFLAIVLTGEVAVLMRDQDGVDKRIAVVREGASLGEMSLINGKPRSATCVALEPTDIAVLTRDTIYDILVLNPSLGNKLLLILLQIVSQRLRETSERLLPFLARTMV